MNSSRALELQRLRIPTSDGDFIASYSANGLAELRFPPSKATNIAATTAIKPNIQRWHQQTTAAVNAILAGQPPEALPPLDLSNGTDFQRSVWQAMLNIRTGHTQSYGEIAKAIGKPGAVRAVGGACGANPIPLLVPCHRVLAAHQKIGGFSGGLEWKRKLLAREGVMLRI
jgi:methylated-DNA-[protein]-cysteine S-methyltransferase